MNMVARAPMAARDLRCECGKLLARVVRQVVELKCPRCKRVVLVADGRTYADPSQPACACCASNEVSQG